MNKYFNKIASDYFKTVEEFVASQNQINKFVCKEKTVCNTDILAHIQICVDNKIRKYRKCSILFRYELYIYLFNSYLFN